MAQPPGDRTTTGTTTTGTTTTGTTTTGIGRVMRQLGHRQHDHRHQHVEQAGAVVGHLDLATIDLELPG
ncbi:MAG: hypothetical protein ACRD2C_25220 [Acidimicrobiales bacterium]